MASTYSPTLRIELIGDGDQSGIWGQTTNNNLGALLEQAITGVVTILMVDANYTLTSYNGVVDEARNAVIVATGTNSAQRNIVAPLVEKTYTIKNNTTGGYAVQIIGASGTGVVIPNGATASVYCDGTNFYPLQVNTVGNQIINGNLTVTGTTTLVGALSGSTATFSGAISSVSPSFTGVPVAPTAAAGTSTTQIATTAFVNNFAGTLGTMSTQNANNVAISGGTINGVSGTNSGLNVGLATNATNLTGVAQLCGYSVSGQSISYAAAGGPQVTGQGGGAAMMSFHRPGSYAINFGLDSDNQLKTGGWSRGGSYVILDAGNYNSYAPTLTGANASGTWNINVTGNAATVTNGVYNNGGTYSINISGNAATATTATTANSLNASNSYVGANFTATGAVYSSGAGGFVSSTYVNNARNPIWYLGNATGYGLSFYQGSSGIGGQDTISLHPNGVTTSAGASFSVTSSGNAYLVGNLVLSAANYNSYAPTLTGGNASGTWNINVTGNSGTSSQATNATNVNGGNVACSGVQITSSNPTIWMYDSDQQDFAMHVNSNLWYVLNQGGAGVMYVDQSGNFTAAGNVTAYSDESIKDNWKPLDDDYLEKLVQVKSGTYDRTDLENKRQAGVSAQDIQKILPEVVQELQDHKLSLAYGNLAVVTCIKLAERLLALEAEVKALKGE